MSEKASSKKDTPKKLTMMISSTARDLPAHRKEVEDACLRQGMFPMMMEHLPASDSEAIKVSLELVDEADIYVGVFAHRYGYVPKDNNPQQISITEMEYNRAVERKIPRLIFIIDKQHPLADFTINDIDTGESAVKLSEFKSRIEKENIVNYFKSPADLRAHVINSLSKLRKPDLTAFHYISDIPAPPEAFIAHPYTLLQTHRLVGRQQKLSLLTDWVTREQEQIYQAHILSIVDIGGMGKSALTWKWFQEIAPQEMNPLAGRMWWSFYESDVRFENFVTRALAYVTRRPLDEVQDIPSPDREAQLLAALDREPFLIVMDGLERILIAYARMDAAHLMDSQVEDKKSLRKTADPREGRFLKKLAQVKNSHILVSTRLYPAELETDGGDPIPRTFRRDIEGLTDEDAIELWRTFEVTGSRDELLPVFATFDKHPLLIQALAGEIKRYRNAPGDFQEWRKANPRFDPAQFPRLQEAMSHVLEFALRELDDRARRALRIIAAFRMPASYDTLVALLMGEEKPCAGERELDEVLTELEDRGLMGWDKRANRYDVHPIVRAVVWSSLGDDTRRDVYTSLHAHFEAMPKIANWREVNSLEDLSPALELYNTLIGLRQYDDAIAVFRDHLSEAMHFRLSASRQQIELLERLFPNGAAQFPRLSQSSNQAYAFNALALAYKLAGQPGCAMPLYIRHNDMQGKAGDNGRLHVGLCNLSDARRLLGSLHEAEVAVRSALRIARVLPDGFAEAYSLWRLGVTLATQGVESESEVALRRSLKILEKITKSQTSKGVVNSYRAQRSLWLKKYRAALQFADCAWEFAQTWSAERDFIYAARRQGEAALGLDDFDTADERLHHALARAWKVNFVEEELPALVALAELRRRQSKLEEARELLDDLWEAAERGPYPLFHSDACNVLAQIERDEGNLSAATDAATKAFRLAWCDGPPFAYHRGLTAARKHL
ncbi:MAG: DUF4062 domain-containing protein, partial [Blastocatellia bacterium]|nr:DUF4062 domain-containing protein [Blastocatellia bacterium]